MVDVIDLSHLDMLKEVIGEDLKEILDVFIQTAPAELQGMQQALISADVQALKLHSHTLKGSAANVGATGLSQLSKLVEDAAKANELASVDETLQGIESTLNDVIVALTNYTKTI